MAGGKGNLQIRIAFLRQLFFCWGDDLTVEMNSFVHRPSVNPYRFSWSNSVPFGERVDNRVDRATGLVLGNPAYRLAGDGAAEYDMWSESFRQRTHSLGGWAEVFAQAGIMNAAMRSALPVMGNLLRRAGAGNVSAFLFTTIALSAVVSGAMTVYQRARYGAPGGTGFFGQWLTAGLTSLPAMMLGMGVMQRWGVGVHLVHDVLMEFPQAALGVAATYAMEGAGVSHESRMDVWQRYRMELCEGLFSLSAGRVTGCGIDAVKARLSHWKIEEGSLPFWQSGVSISKALDLVRDGRAGEIPPPPKGCGDVEIRWRTRRYLGDIDLDGSGQKNGALVVREMLIPDPHREGVAPQRAALRQAQGAAWLMAFRKDADGRISPDNEKNGIVLDAWFGSADIQNPFRKVSVWRPERGKNQRIEYEVYDEEIRRHKYVSRLVGSGDVVVLRDARVAVAVLNSAALLMGRLDESAKAAYALSLMDARYGEFKGKVDEANLAMMTQVLRPLYGTIMAIDKAASNDAGFRGELACHGGDLPDVARLVADELRTVHLFSEEDARFEVETFGRLEAERFAKDKGGKPRFPNWRVVAGQLKDVEGEGERRRLYEEYVGALYNFHAGERGLFSVVDQMSEIARTGGLSGYPDKFFPKNMGMTGREFVAGFDKLMSGTEPLARRYVGELSRIKQTLDPASGGKVYAWDVDYLHNKWMQEKMGDVKEPTLTYDEARGVIDRVLADLGMSRPTGLVEDLFAREGKVPMPGMTLPAMMERSYITMSMEQGERVSLRRLEEILHETVHAIHTDESANRANDRFVFMSEEYGIRNWREGVAKVIGKLVQDPLLAGRYLDGFPQFTEDYFRTVNEVMLLRGAFDQREQLLIARAEYDLYAGEGSVGERLKGWYKNRLRYQEIHDLEDGRGYWLGVPHLVYKDYHLFYGAYPLGEMQVGRIFDSTVREGTPAELRVFGTRMRGLMQRGPRVTLADLQP